MTSNSETSNTVGRLNSLGVNNGFASGPMNPLDNLEPRGAIAQDRDLTNSQVDSQNLLLLLQV